MIITSSSAKFPLKRVYLFALIIGAGVLAFASTAHVSVAQAPPDPSGQNARAEKTVTGRPLPRFAAVRGEVARMRKGPGFRYPIEWIYRKRGLPVQIIAEYETWRKIRDWQGDQGWMHATLLTGKRTVIITGGRRNLRAEPRQGAEVVARAEAGVLAELLRCEEDSAWCGIRIDGHTGWVRRDEIWGVDPNEVYPKE